MPAQVPVSSPTLWRADLRYEREYGQAQRPIVRRIQEQDSSAALPMVLCVSRVHRPEPERNEQGQLVPQQPYLTLTDGWYHIKAFGDEYLCRAITKGRISVGMKLGLAGAQVSFTVYEILANISSKPGTTERKSSTHTASRTSPSQGTRRTRRRGMRGSASSAPRSCAGSRAWQSMAGSWRSSMSLCRSCTRSGFKTRTTPGIPGTRPRKRSARESTR